MSPRGPVPPPWSVDEARAHLRRVDARMAALMDAVGDVTFEIHPPPSLFEALAQAIVYQQLNGKAAATIHGRFVAAFRPRRHPTPADVLAADPAALRACGLSTAKTAAIRDLAARVEARQLPTLAQLARLDDDAIAEAVTTVRGIGRWTADMLLMFRLGRPDVLPVGDYGVQQGTQRVYRLRTLPTAAVLERRAAAWRPWRTLGSWYMWRALELG